MLNLHIGTTRFNTRTFEENRKFCQDNHIIGCLYGLPVSMPSMVRRGEMVFIIEMNIETKQIMGIGKVINFRHRDKYYRIYSEPGYNRYIYKGIHRIPSDNIQDKECLNILEKILFKGKGHMCRGHGITRLDPKKLTENKEKIKKFLKQLFV